MDTPRKHPRSLQEAFGPYTDNNVYEHERSWVASDIAIAILFVFMLLVIIFGAL